MIFIESRIDLGYNYGTTGGPRFKTTVVVDGGGREQRICQWAQPLHSYSFFRGEDNPIDNLELAYLQDFHRSANGSINGFRFRDWADYQIVDQMIGIGDGSQTDFQIYKGYNWAGYWTMRPITKPVASSMAVRLSGVQTDDFSLDTTTGLISFSRPPAAGSEIVVSCEFDVPVRFKQDTLNNRFLSANVKESPFSNPLAASVGQYALYSLEQVEFEEIRIPPAIAVPLVPPQTFIDDLLPIGYAYGSVGGPQYSNSIEPLDSGYDSRVKNQESPRRRYDVGEIACLTEQAAELLSAFWVCRGSAVSFSYLDRHQPASRAVIRCRFENDQIRHRFDHKNTEQSIFTFPGFSVVECL